MEGKPPPLPPSDQLTHLLLTRRQVFKQNFHNASDFDLKILQRVRFWIEKYNATDFELKEIKRVRF